MRPTLPSKRSMRGAERCVQGTLGFLSGARHAGPAGPADPAHAPGQPDRPPPGVRAMSGAPTSTARRSGQADRRAEGSPPWSDEACSLGVSLAKVSVGLQMRSTAYSEQAIVRLSRLVDRAAFLRRWLSWLRAPAPRTGDPRNRARLVGATLSPVRWTHGNQSRAAPSDPSVDVRSEGPLW